jgi:hypothetical protein
VRIAADAPWLLAPAGLVFLTVLAVHTAAHTEDRRAGVDFASKSF